VSVTKGDTVLVRGVASIADDAVRLATPVDLQGDVRVAPYSLTRPDSLWDWHDWYPVTFPDESRPASLKVEAVGGKTLELHAHDRVSVSVRGTTKRTNVTAVAQDGTVELEEIPGHGVAPGDVRIAKVGGNDPIGDLDLAAAHPRAGHELLPAAAAVAEPAGHGAAALAVVAKAGTAKTARVRVDDPATIPGRKAALIKRRRQPGRPPAPARADGQRAAA
jgi:hypothetical protein